MDKITNDPKNANQYFENLVSYLDGIKDLTPDSNAQGFIMIFQMILHLLRGEMGIVKSIGDYKSETESKMNSILERLIKIENELEAIRKGK